MKLSWGVALSALLASAWAEEDHAQAHVYLFDSEPKSSSPQAAATVEPWIGRSILAQRFGLSQFHEILPMAEEEIALINAYGGRQQKLFGREDPASSKAHLLIWAEDVEDPKEFIKRPSSWTSHFTIPGPFTRFANRKMLEQFGEQAQSLPKYDDPKGNTYRATLNIETSLEGFAKLNVYNEYLTIAQVENPIKDGFLDKIQDLLDGSMLSKEHAWSITLVLMPPRSAHTKRDAELETRRESTEAFLSPASAQPSSSPNVPENLEDFPIIAQAQANDSAPVLGILNSCFSTLAACQKQTHNCSSHGECKLIHKGDGKGSDSQVQDCYGCACVPTVVKVGEDHGMESRHKTTYWGGPACQKKDLSVPFWLFVGTGVILAVLVGSGISMLYSMGSEELPSVIGAGVSGPPRK